MVGGVVGAGEFLYFCGMENVNGTPDGFPALSAAVRKRIRSLALARNRRAEGLFVAEGHKCVLDLASAFSLELVAATREWLQEHASELPGGCTVYAVSPAELERLSLLSTPQDVLAVFRLPQENNVDVSELAGRLVVALDCVQDPGNVGTIVRMADWMGVDTVLLGSGTADVFGPKTVQATMGSLARVRTIRCELTEVLPRLRKAGMEVYVTALNGQDIYSCPLTAAGVVVMGNEGRGVSDEVRALASRSLLIPPYPADAPTAESLNVAVATALTLGEFRRRVR